MQSSQSAPAGEPDDATLSLTLPQLKWQVAIDVPGFALEIKEYSKNDEGAHLVAVNETSGLNLSLFLEKAASPGDAKAARDHYWSRVKQSLLPKSDIKLWEREGMAIAEYLVKEIEEIPLNQKHLNAYLAHKGYWIDLHISKTLFEPSDEALFQAVLDAVHIGKSPAGKTCLKVYSVKDHGSLVLDIPATWLDSVGPARRMPGPTLALRPRKGKEFNIQMTFFDHPEMKGYGGQEGLKGLIDAELDGMLKQAVEKEAKLLKLKGKKVDGIYYTVTDPAPKPGEFKYMTRAWVGTGDLIASVTVLAHKKNPRALKDALAMLESARHEPPRKK